MNFPDRTPRLEKNNSSANKEIYFININRSIIFHIYDDRRLEIISTNKEEIRPIYEEYSKWILDYDRDLIDKQMK